MFYDESTLEDIIFIINYYNYVFDEVKDNPYPNYFYTQNSLFSIQNELSMYKVKVPENPKSVFDDMIQKCVKLHNLKQVPSYETIGYYAGINPSKVSNLANGKVQRPDKIDVLLLCYTLSATFEDTNRMLFALGIESELRKKLNKNDEESIMDATYHIMVEKRKEESVNPIGDVRGTALEAYNEIRSLILKN